MSPEKESKFLVVSLDETSQAWQEQAACSSIGLTARADFYPPPGERTDARARRESRAKAVCAGCIVRSQCLDYATTNGEHGIWGGTTEDERPALPKRR